MEVQKDVLSLCILQILCMTIWTKISINIIQKYVKGIKSHPLLELGSIRLARNAEMKEKSNTIDCNTTILKFVNLVLILILKRIEHASSKNSSNNMNTINSF